MQNMQRLLRDDDPAPVDFFNPNGKSPVLLVCEHAGKRVPQQLDGLGLAPQDMEKHVGWDIGAAAVAIEMAKSLDAPAILQRYSRLVIDCNRPPEAPDAMPKVADQIYVPGNVSLSKSERQQRADEIFWPFHHAVDKAIQSKQFRIVLSVHSFTPQLGDERRPWPLAFLFRGDIVTPKNLADQIRQEIPGINIGMNQPYQIDEDSDWFVPQHGEKNQIAHSLIEINNDQIKDRKGQKLWASHLVKATLRLLENLL